MSKSQEKKTKIEKCHFCNRDLNSWFLFDLHNEIDSSNRSQIPVCGIHFDKLCNMTYVDSEQSYLSAGQKEYISVKKLEKKLGITTRHK